MRPRELGNPLGNPLGLAKVLGVLSINPTIVDFINGASGDFVIPDGFSFFRVTVVGAGGSGFYRDGTFVYFYSGAGGGLARSAILPIKKGTLISYVAAPMVTYSDPSGSGQPSTAKFLDVSLVATGGQGATSSARGGMGSGGVVNYRGGNVESASSNSGAGAAGTNSNGADSVAAGTGKQVAGLNSAGDAGGSGAAQDQNPMGGGGWMGVGQGMPASGSYYAGGGPIGDLASRNAKGSSGGGWGGGGAGRGAGGYGGVRIELW